MRCIGLAVFTLFALLGCATEYVVKPSDPTAYLRLVTNTSESTVFLHVPQKVACAGSAGQLLAKFNWLEGKQLSGVRMLGSTGEPSDRVYERRVVAGQPFYLLAFTERSAAPYTPGHHCAVGARTVWEPGQHYEVAFAFGNGGCDVQVSRLVQSGDTVEKIPDAGVRFIRARFTKDLCDK